MKKDDIFIAKKEHFDLIKRFIEMPRSETVIKDAIDLERKYANLAAYNEVFSKKIVPQELIDAISFLQRIYQYEDDLFDNEETMNVAKDLLKKL